MNGTFSTRKVIIGLSSITVLLVIAHLIAKWMMLTNTNTTVFKIARAFDLDYERSVPTFFNIGLLFICTLLLLMIALAHKRAEGGFSYWLTLSFIFLFLTFDEFFGLHERLNGLRSLVHTSGLLYFLWVLPYAIAVLAIGVTFLRFLWNSPPRFRMLCIVAGVMYVGGALGLEALGGSLFDATRNDTSFVYLLLIAVEEICEFVGLILFIYALMWYMEYKNIQIGVANGLTPLNATFSSGTDGQLEV